MASSLANIVTGYSVPLYRFDGRYASVMDSILAIALGLGLRVLLEVIGQNDIRIEGSLVGLWEGAVLAHFVEKWPKSYDPYVGFGFRLLVDFLMTENISRMVIIVLWTGVGMMVSDVGPVLWHSTGLRRLSRIVSRDLTRLGIPGLQSFSKNTSTRVRFSSPSRASSQLSPHSPQDTPAMSLLHDRPRPLPGSFPGDTETETEPSITGGASDADSSAGDPGEAISGTGAPTDSLNSETLSGSDTEHEPSTTGRTPTVLVRELPQPDHDIPEIDEDDLFADQLLRPLNSAEIPVIPDTPVPDAQVPSFAARATSGISFEKLAPLPPIPPDHVSHFPPEPEPAKEENQNTGETSHAQEAAPPTEAGPSAETGQSAEQATQSTEVVEPTEEPGKDNRVADAVVPTVENPEPQGEVLGKRTAGDRHSVPETEFTQESVISGHDPTHIIKRASDIRDLAKKREVKRDELKTQLADARKQRKWQEAFKFKLALRDLTKQAAKLNEKAARRFHHAHNMDSPPEMLVVQHLTLDEAMDLIESKLGEMWADEANDATLRVDVGPRPPKEKSKTWPLKQGIQSRFNDQLHIPITDDPQNPHVLIIKPPSP